MRILWVATKPPWPPLDGGRLLLANTLEALAAAGCELTLVAPAGTPSPPARPEAGPPPPCRTVAVPVRRRPLLVDAVSAQLRRRPLSIVRHDFPAVRRRVAELLDAGGFDLVQAEQAQALSSAGPALGRRLPVVLRAQNVESDLWTQSARRETWRRGLLAREGRRLAAWEGQAVRRCAATVVLTSDDRRRLAVLSDAGEKIHRVPAPFAGELPAATGSLPGSPPVVLFGSSGWRPNALGAAAFVREAWPGVLRALPDAMLHVFGLEASAAGVRCHPAPADSRTAFVPGSILVVPLEIASGVRIKILEAWARGVPVVATPAAARGLDAEDGAHLLLAGDAAAFAAALSRVARETGLAPKLVAAGRELLRERHAPARVAERLGSIYASLVE